METHQTEEKLKEVLPLIVNMEKNNQRSRENKRNSIQIRRDQ